MVVQALPSGHKALGLEMDWSQRLSQQPLAGSCWSFCVWGGGQFKSKPTYCLADFSDAGKQQPDFQKDTPSSDHEVISIKTHIHTHTHTLFGR